MNSPSNPFWRYVASFSLMALIALCLTWELWWAPLRPGGSLLALKAVPLLFPLTGVLKGRLYTYQWAAMLILLYLMEGVVRAWSDPDPASSLMGGIEVALSLVFYVAAICYVRPAKRAARQRAKAVNGSESHGLRP